MSRCSSGPSTTRASTSTRSSDRSGTASVSSTASPASSPISSASCPELLADRRAAVRVAGGPHGPGPDLSAAVSRGPRGRDAPRPSLRGQALADLSGGFLRFRGTHGDDDLYEIAPLPERGVLLERVGSYDLLVSRPRLWASLRPLLQPAGVLQWVSLTLNGATLTRIALDRPTSLSATLTGPLRQAEPNVLAFEYEYRRSAAALGPAHRLGTTGVKVPVDVAVRSGGQPYGDVASIRVGIGELALNRRGYNLVALEPGARSGIGLPSTPAAIPGKWSAGQLGRALPAGAIVLGAVKDEASARSPPMRSGPWPPSGSAGTFGAAVGNPTRSSG